MSQGQSVLDQLAKPRSVLDQLSDPVAAPPADNYAGVPEPQVENLPATQYPAQAGKAAARGFLGSVMTGAGNLGKLIGDPSDPATKLMRGPDLADPAVQQHAFETTGLATDPRFAGSKTEKVFSMAGGAVPYVLAGAEGAPVKALAGMAGMSAALNGYYDPRAKTDEQRWANAMGQSAVATVSTLAGGPLAKLGALPKFFAQINAATAGGLSKALGQAAISTAQGTMAGTAQGLGSELIANHLFLHPDQRPKFAEALQDAYENYTLPSFFLSAGAEGLKLAAIKVEMAKNAKGSSETQVKPLVDEQAQALQQESVQRGSEKVAAFAEREKAVRESGQGTGEAPPDYIEPGTGLSPARGDYTAEVSKGEPLPINTGAVASETQGIPSAERTAHLNDPDVVAYTTAKAKEAKPGNAEPPPTEEPTPYIGLPKETRAQAGVRKIADNLNRLITLNKSVEKATGKAVEPNIDVRMSAELRRGKTSDLQEIRTRVIEEPIAKLMAAKPEHPVEEVHDFLASLHTPKRESLIQTREGKAQGAGWDYGALGDPQDFAQSRLSGPDGEFWRGIQQANRRVNKMKLGVAVKAGILSKDQARNLVADFGEDFVTLKSGESIDPYLEGEMMEDVGRGVAVTTPTFIRARGRSTKAEGPLYHQLADLDRMIVRAQKNEVARTAARLVKAQPGLGWTLNEMPSNPLEQGAVLKDPKNVPYYENGKRGYIRVEDSLTARQLRSIGNVDIPENLQKLQKASRAITSLYTKYDVDFVAANIVGDIQQAISTAGIDKSLVTAKNVSRDLKPAYKALRNIRQDPLAAGEWESTAREYQRLGGKISIYDQPRVETAQKRLESLISAETPGPLHGVKTARAWYEGYVGDTEAMTNLAAFKAMKDAGMDPRAAAQAAKNIKVNFELSGEWGPYINAFVPLFRAGAGGTLRTAKLLAGPRGRRAAMALAGAGATYAAASYQLGGDDSDGIPRYDKIPVTDKERNLCLLLPQGSSMSGPMIGETEGASGPIRYIKIPLGRGLIAASMNAGVNIAAVVENTRNPRGGKSPSEAATNTFGFALDSANPLSGTPLQMITPWFLDPFVAVAENQTYAGVPHHPGEMPNDPTPASQLAYSSASPMAKSAAEGLNKLSGGSQYRSGKVDVYPAFIDDVVRTLTGGPGKLVKEGISIAQSLRAGEAPPISQIPVARRFAGNAGDTEDWKRYNKFSDEINTQYKELRGGESEGPIVGAHKILLSTQRQISAARKELAAAREAGDSKAEKAAREDISATLKEFNATVLDVLYPKNP